MPRVFDGTDDNIGFGSDASIDDKVAITVALRLRWDASGVADVFVGKAVDNTNGWRLTSTSGNKLAFTRDYSTNLGAWSGSTNLNGATVHSLILSHDGDVGSTPRMVVNGAAETVTVDLAPNGTLVADAGSNLLMGEGSSGTNDLAGAIGWCCYSAQVWDTAMENRFRWWGTAPGGPSTLLVWHPFWASDLVNKGTATANGTANGTTMGALAVPVVRPGTAMMGMGVGW